MKIISASITTTFFLICALLATSVPCLSNELGDSYFDSVTKTLDILRDGTVLRTEERIFTIVDPSDLYTLLPIRVSIFSPYEKLVLFEAFTCDAPPCRGDNMVPVTYERRSVHHNWGVHSYFFKLDPGELHDALICRIETLSRPIIKGHFWDILSINELFPSNSTEFSVNIPSGISLYYQSVSQTAQPVVEEQDNNKQYTWVINKTPSVPSPQITILISSTAAWSELAVWLASEYWKKSDQKGKIPEWTASILDTHNSDKAKLISFILRRLQLNFSIVNGDSGHPFIPAEAGVIFDRREGDCKDLSVLIVSLLQAAGIESFPVLTNTNQTYRIRKMLPSPYHFNHSLVYVPIQYGVEAPMLIDPVNFSVIPKEDLQQQVDGLLLDIDHVRFVDFSDIVF